MSTKNMFFTKICWNTEYWQKPSGLIGKSKDKKSHERKYGYGHEEWLLDTSKTIDGYHYAHMQAVCKTTNKSIINNTFGIVLFSRDSHTEKFWKIGTISNVEHVGERKSCEVYAKYKKNGWIEEMTKQLIDVQADNESFNHLNKDSSGFVCLKFKPNDLKLKPKLIENQDFIKKLSDYKRYQIHELLELENLSTKGLASIPFEKGHKQKSSTAKGRGSYERQKEIDLVHNKMQEEIFKILSEDYDVNTERQVETGGAVDISVKIDESSEIFYEIKTSNTVKGCIRESLGQLMEYAYYPPNIKRIKNFIIVSQNSLDNDGKKYIEKLRADFKLPIFYQQFILGDNKLSDAYPSNPLEVNCD